MFSGLVSGVSVSAAQDLFELKASPTGAGLMIHRIEVGQDASETSEILPIQLMIGKGHTEASNGAAVTPARIKAGQGSPTATLTRNNTTIATAGTGTLTAIARRDFNVVVGWWYEPPQPQAPTLAPGESLIVRLPTAPAGALTMTAEIIWEEI